MDINTVPQGQAPVIVKLLGPYLLIVIACKKLSKLSKKQTSIQSL